MSDLDDDLLCTTDPNVRHHAANNAGPDFHDDDVDDTSQFENELRERKYQHEMEVAVENARQDQPPSSAQGFSAARKIVPLPGDSQLSARRMSSSQSRAGPDVARLHDEIRGLTNQLRSHERAAVQMNSESDKQQKMISSLNGRIDREVSEKKELAQRCKLAESQLVAARKEIQLLQRQVTQAPGSENAPKEDVRLQRAINEIEALRSQLTTPQVGGPEPVELSRLRNENKKLESQRLELIQCIRKQNRLIDVLKRQKMHLEAAKLLQITEEEFVKTLEINHR
jgi:chromosome segregation ATPase